MTVGIGFCKYFFFCYIQYDTSSNSIDCSVPFFLYRFPLSCLNMDVIICEFYAFLLFISAWESFQA